MTAFENTWTLRRTRGVPVWLIVAGLFVFAPGCGERPTPQPPPPPKVTVAQPMRRVVTDSLDITGNTQAIYSVQLVARVAGYLEKVLFQDGQVVDSSSQTVAAPMTPGGTSVTEFHLVKASGWPTGDYTVEVWLDGQSAGTRRLTVKR